MNKPLTQNEPKKKVVRKGVPSPAKGIRKKRISKANNIQGEVMDILERVAVKNGLSLLEVKRIYEMPFLALDRAIEKFNPDDPNTWICMPFKYIGQFEPNLHSINAIRRYLGLPKYEG